MVGPVKVFAIPPLFAFIFHRDLKPDNVFLLERDDGASFVKIVDFGISKIQPGSEIPTQTLTREGAVIGTPYYMSPEQALGRSDVDHRTDLWAVGAIFFECLTGRPPLLGKSYEELIVAICSSEVDDVREHAPQVSEAIAEVVATALTRDRDARFATARQFLDALTAAEAGIVPSIRPKPARALAVGKLERAWVPIVLAVLAAGTLVGYLFYRFLEGRYFR